jgi:hypothetical protein
MSGMKSLLAFVAAVTVLAGCKTNTVHGAQAARIVDPTDASRAALQETVNALLNTDVTLADNALVDSSLLIIERNVPRKIDSPPAQGRIMDMPIQFQLVTDGSDCVLIDKRDDSRHRLDNTVCAAE